MKRYDREVFELLGLRIVVDDNDKKGMGSDLTKVRVE